METYGIGGIIEDASIDDTGHRVINRLHLTEVSVVRDEQTKMEGVEWWCHSCKNHFVVSWAEIDQLRAEGKSIRVLCRCRRWLGNISVGSRISSLSVL